jgi:cyclase
MNRLVPSLILDDDGAWVTKLFKKSVYLGEPSNVVRIMNELLADELSITWIGRNRGVRNAALELISSQASMPLSYCGAIAGAEEAVMISRLGFERIGVTSSFLKDPAITKSIADELGRSSISLRIPVSGPPNALQVWDWQGGQPSGMSLDELLDQIPIDYVGEVVLTSVDHNGTQAGHRPEIIESLKKLTSIQRGYEGGVCSPSEVSSIWKLGVDAVYASSFLFLYGRFDAPLTDYPAFEPGRYIS